ncbi:MAG: sulfatase-like hydrolase/transferase, partial [Bacteroidaceae bacterium]
MSAHSFFLGIRFTNFHANCPVSSPSRASLLPQMTKQCGYKSAIIGKWHLGLNSPNTPNERGFDYMRENDQEINPQGHATDIFTDASIKYIQEQETAIAPFFLYLAYNAPHGPIQPPKEWYEKVRKREPNATETRVKLIALIEHLDYNIGKVYDTLEATGQLENTLIIFASDNGGDYYAGANNKPFRGAKQDMYEGGIC